jgi:hypothetical protein
MKELIVNVGILLLLLAFPMQYALDQHNHHKKSEFQYYVNAAKEKAKQEGYFTDQILNEFTNNVTDALNIPKSKIIINVTKTRKYRTNEYDERELIYYEFSIPINNIIAVNHLWGIPDANNKMMYTVNGTTTSEALLN